jgi:hypothetical protein
MPEFPLGFGALARATNKPRPRRSRRARTYSCMNTTFRPPLPTAVGPQKQGGQGLAGSFSCHSRYVAHTSRGQPLPREPARMPSARTGSIRSGPCTSTSPAQRVQSAESSPVTCRLSPVKSLAPTGTITTLAAFAQCCRTSVAYGALGLRERIKFIAVACPVYQLTPTATPEFASPHPAEASVGTLQMWYLWYRRAHAIKSVVCARFAQGCESVNLAENNVQLCTPAPVTP